MSRMSCPQPFLTSAFIIFFFLESPHAPIRASARPTELEKLLAQFRNGRRLAPIHSSQPNWKQNSHKLRATVVGDRGSPRPPRRLWHNWMHRQTQTPDRSVMAPCLMKKKRYCIDLFSLLFAQDDAIVAPTVPSIPLAAPGASFQMAPSRGYCSLDGGRPRTAWARLWTARRSRLDGTVLAPNYRVLVASWRHVEAPWACCAYTFLARQVPVRADQRLSASFRRCASNFDPY
ncbi:hypothetical protein EDB87DRAFT_1618794 [Lactarius vividus]|nr:hypothetical protein EDB87DRAFT_1618794 [Lactarius vividus]